jgi:hypothetical protein
MYSGQNYLNNHFLNYFFHRIDWLIRFFIPFSVRGTLGFTIYILYDIAHDIISFYHIFPIRNVLRLFDCFIPLLLYNHKEFTFFPPCGVICFPRRRVLLLSFRGPHTHQTPSHPPPPQMRRVAPHPPEGSS